MLNRTISRRSILHTRWLAAASLPPPPLPFLPLLPSSQSRHFNSTTPIIDGDSIGSIIPEGLTAPDFSRSTRTPNPPPPTSPSTHLLPSSTSSTSSTSTPSPPRVPPHPSLRTLLPLLKAQQSHYITVHIHARPYLLTVGDAVRLPFHMPGVVPGDILRLTRASVIGSRDYTWKSAGPGQYLDERLFECRARVMGVESEPMRVEEKTRRRQRRVKTVKNKLKYTVLKLAELRIGDVQELEREGGI